MDDLPEAKVYFDGSHYIAIPHTTRPYRRRKKKKDELVVILPEKEPEQVTIDSLISNTSEPYGRVKEKPEQSLEQIIKTAEKSKEPLKTLKVTTKKQLFNDCYAQTKGMKRKERYDYLYAHLRQYFASDETASKFIEDGMYRMYRNSSNRKIRFYRKANMNAFNYFATFTYDDRLHTESTFRKKLVKCLQNYHTNKQWTYIGVWEKSESDRLHFHCILNIPDGTMPGELIEKKDYNTTDKRMRVSLQNTFFNKRFGRCDFAPMPENKFEKAKTIKYLVKYLEKTGEKIVYSRGLKTYVISDIMAHDIVCPIGVDDKKALLFDNFTCWDEGTLIGKVSAETIEQLRKSN